MKQISIAVSFIIAITAVFLLTASSKKQVIKDIVVKIKKADEKGFAVMELFTSQGCSSCPPADELLGKYALMNNEQIIPLSFHVDYWNRLGWIDSFSNAKFSQRQRDYATSFNTESVYTPQLVINGQKELVGSESGKIAALLNEVLKEKPLLLFSISNIIVIENKVTVYYKADGFKEDFILFAALLQKKVYTNIKAGENRGVKLTNYNVVRDFIATDEKNTIKEFTLQLPNGAVSTDFSIVLLAQDKKSGKITGALQKTL